MKRVVAFALLWLLLVASGSAAAGNEIPWATVSELEVDALETSALRGCGDPRPMGLYVVPDGAGAYHAIVSAELRWVILGPIDKDGKTRIWYGTVTPADQLLIEHSILGTPSTDVCPMLNGRKA